MLQRGSFLNFRAYEVSELKAPHGRDRSSSHKGSRSPGCGRLPATWFDLICTGILSGWSKVQRTKPQG